MVRSGRRVDECRACCAQHRPATSPKARKQRKLPKHGGSDPSEEHNRRLSTERVVAALFAAAVLGSVSWVWLLHAHPEFSKLSNGASVVSALRGKYLYAEKDYQGAAKLFLQAAENGSAEAADILGTLYEYGLGTQPDCKTAMTWFRKAAKKVAAKRWTISDCFRARMWRQIG